MRFLLCSHGAGAYGAERVLTALGKGLAERGHHVTMEIPHDGPAVRAARASGLNVWISRRTRLPRNASEAIRFFASFPSAVRRVHQGIRIREPDVVWASSLYALPAVLAARLARTPVVWHLHERNLRGPLAPLIGLGVRLLPDAAAAVSDYVRDSFVRRDADAVDRLPNPLLERRATRVEGGEAGDTDAGAGNGGRPDAAPDAPFRLVCIGQLEPRKRVVDAVAAVAAVEGAELTVVGDGKARRRVEAAVARAGAGDRIRLAGFQEDIEPFLAAAQAVLMPSVREPFGLVALEAMAAGVPVIAARSGALPEVLGDTALYYPAGDTAALAHRIRELRSDPDRAAELGRQGRQRVRAFDAGAWVDAAERLARRVARADHPGDPEPNRAP